MFEGTRLHCAHNLRQERDEIMIRWMLQRKAAAKCARRACRRMAGKHGQGVWLTVRYSPDWDSEKGVVDEELRIEQRKRGLR